VTNHHGLTWTEEIQYSRIEVVRNQNLMGAGWKTGKSSFGTHPFGSVLLSFVFHPLETFEANPRAGEAHGGWDGTSHEMNHLLTMHEYNGVVVVGPASKVLKRIFACCIGFWTMIAPCKIRTADC
jgi:hypothetical protein